MTTSQSPAAFYLRNDHGNVWCTDRDFHSPRCAMFPGERSLAGRSPRNARLHDDR